MPCCKYHGGASKVQSAASALREMAEKATADGVQSLNNLKFRDHES